MKITAIVPTGEVRVPCNGEYIHNGIQWLLVLDCNSMSLKYPIAQAHEVEVPDNIDELSLSARIHIPRKKKVKKWQFESGTPSGVVWRTAEHYSQKEIDELLLNCCGHKLLDSEIEVEE